MIYLRQTLHAALLLIASLHATVLVAEESWQTVSKESFSLLWKEITETRLQVDRQQAWPVSGNILTPDYAKQIIIEYKVGVSAERFQSLTMKALTEAFTETELRTAMDDIVLFCTWYQDISKGDQYRLSWRPNTGLTLYLNEDPLGVIRDSESAMLILSVWLGRAAVSESQRDTMLAAWQKSFNKKR